MSRILVLGGTGVTGRAVLERLGRELPEAEVDYASRRPSERIARPWVRLDLSGPSERTELALAGYDWVVLCAGPFERLRASAHRHCLRAGVGCIDVNDSIDARREIVALDGEARRAGAPVLTGFGLCPGISTILLAELLDSADPRQPVRELETRLLVGGKQEPGAASMESMFATMTGPWRALVDGRERLMPAALERLPGRDGYDYLIGYECPDIDRVREFAPGLRDYRYRAWFGQIGADSARRMQSAGLLRVGWLAPRLARLGARIGARRVERLGPIPEDARVIVIATDGEGRRRSIQATGAPSFRLTGACAGAALAAAVRGEFSPAAGVHEIWDLPEARAAVRRRLTGSGLVISAIEELRDRGPERGGRRER
ncbi:hypothetical protein [uncultured Propionibacterium sp.]|uniref:hypothetical protein n=1 Tax=uncultured Propionibacterium sp. TaxID=218066 RepID=UPI00293053FD|nr:hypothetical protein [uncultured Propionibacterium sp.]